MPAAIDISGRRYGRLTAMCPDFSTDKRRWLFMCDCGTSVLMPSSYASSGRTSSCGCLRRETTAKNRFIDQTGKRIGRLTVLRALPVRTIHKHVQWECLCDCGNSTITTTIGRAKPTMSCGCIQREVARALGASSKKDDPVSKRPGYRKEKKAIRRQRPEVALAERVSRLLSMALAAVGAVKAGSTFSMLGYTPHELRAHIERQFLRGMTWDNRDEWEIDHITPISTAVTKDDVIALNQLSNLRPLWSLHNNQKSSKRHFLL